MRLILASASPRRQQLLREAGYDFEIDPADIDESQYPANLLPAEIARYLAIAKSEVLAPKHPDDVVLAADTVVAFGDTALGKPRDLEDAHRMLSLLEGTTHIVITGVSVVHRNGAHKRSAIAMTAVRMRALSPQEIDRYLETGDWQGKAGGYGIQDRDPFVTRVSGSQSNVVGLPMSLTRAMLKEAGIVAGTPAASPASA